MRRRDESMLLTPPFYDADVRVRDMDRNGVTFSVVSPANPWADSFGPAEAIAVAREVNDDLAELVGSHHSRLGGLGILPMKAPGAAVDELNRLVKDLGLLGVIVGANVDGDPISSRKYREVLAEAARLDVPVFVHPSSPVGSEAMRRYQLTIALGFLFDTTLNTVLLILEGVLERIPRLKLVIGHQAAALPYVIGRLDRAYRDFPELRKNISRPPSHYLKRLYTDTISYDPGTFSIAARALSTDRLLFGSDYPFPLGGGRSSPKNVMHSLPFSVMGEEDGRRILGENAMALLRLRL